MTERKGRGGQRQGAGRKPKSGATRIQKSVSLTPGTWAFVAMIRLAHPGESESDALERICHSHSLFGKELLPPGILPDQLEHREPGYVYLGTGHPEGYTKIGRTIRLDKRFADIKQYGFRVTPVWAAYVSDHIRAEGLLHKYYQHKQRGRKREEWFDLDANDIVFIKDKLTQWADHIIDQVH